MREAWGGVMKLKRFYKYLGAISCQWGLGVNPKHGHSSVAFVAVRCYDIQWESRIISEGAEFVVVNKPAGISVRPQK